MNRLPLSQVCNYSDDSVQVSELNLNNYISTDNMLPNKGGITEAVNLPPANTCSAFSKGEILISNIRPYFKKIWFAEFDGGCSADVLVLKTTNPNFDPKFVYYNLFQDLFFKHQMTGSKGSKMPRGDKDQIMTFLIPEFDKSYQKRVSEFLTVIDEKIALNKKINTELESLAKTIYNYWFVQFDFPNAEGKPYKTSGGEMEWNDELKMEIPKGWKAKPLEKFGDFKNGINYEGDVVGDKIVRIVNVRDISDSNYFILKDNLDEISLPEKDSSKYLVHENDILIARSGTPGATRLIHKDIADVIYCGFIIRYNVAEERMKKYLFFNLKRIEESLTTKSAGTILKNVSQDTLKELLVASPDENTIKRFNEKMNPIFESIYSNSKQNQELIKLRDFLLPLLMNGQVKVKSEVKEQLLMAAEPQVKYGK